MNKVDKYNNIINDIAIIILFRILLIPGFFDTIGLLGK
jgi:hypothetical protein